MVSNADRVGSLRGGFRCGPDDEMEIVTCLNEMVIVKRATRMR